MNCIIPHPTSKLAQQRTCRQAGRSHKNYKQTLNFSMLTQPIRKTFDIGDGRQVTLETGRLARQADGSVTVSIGNCILLATVVANKEPKEGQDFFPLTVDYQEKFASAG